MKKAVWVSPTLEKIAVDKTLAGPKFDPVEGFFQETDPNNPTQPVGDPVLQGPVS